MSNLSQAQRANYAALQAFNAVAVTPSDTGDIPNGPFKLYIGGAGNLKVTLAGMADDSFVTFTGLAAGAFPPIVAKRVWTATTATLILAIS